MKTMFVAVCVLLLTGAALLAACGRAGSEGAPAGADSAETPTPVPPTAEPTPVPPSPTPVPLPVLGPAPAIENEMWLNSDAPLTLADLRGKVVLVEFWTFGCINCKRVIPYINDWYSRYGGDDFEVVGVHYPEFSYEKEVANVQQALLDHAITYPVPIDNDGVTWRAWRQRYWPTRYLVDRSGNIRYIHIGEGAYAETERHIQALIAER